MDKRKDKRNKIPLPRHKDGEQFIKGPLPENWLAQASHLPGKSLNVANLIWKRAGMSGTAEVTLPKHDLVKWGIHRNAFYRALFWLEDAGLIITIRRRGASIIVTILDPPAIPLPVSLHERKVETGQLNLFGDHTANASEVRGPS
jgi:hypothetical protein